MDHVKLRNCIINIQLNIEFEELRKEIDQLVFGQSDFQELNGSYKRFHVSNIPFSYKEADLIALFRRYGPVFGAEIIYNERGSKGFGFLTMYSADADEAFQALNNSIINGRKIEINNATPRKTAAYRTPHKTSEKSTETTPKESQNSTYSPKLHLISPQNSPRIRLLHKTFEHSTQTTPQQLQNLARSQFSSPQNSSPNPQHIRTPVRTSDNSTQTTPQLLLGIPHSPQFTTPQNTSQNSSRPSKSARRKLFPE